MPGCNHGYSECSAYADNNNTLCLLQRMCMHISGIPVFYSILHGASILYVLYYL